MTAIACTDLTRRFGALCAVDSVSLQVGRGEFIALLGPSGCGKTTLLRLLAGFEAPDHGQIVIDGTVVARPGASVPPERRRIGMVFQEHALFPHLDVADNVAYGVPRGVGRAAWVRELLALVGLPECARRMPHQLSGGQQQRVALARALAVRPAAILLDEPFSNLDAGLRAEMRAEVCDILRRAAATACFVTHDQEEALSIADTVAVMRHGRIEQVGTPHEVYTRPASREIARFIGEANLLRGRADGPVAHCALGALPLLVPMHGAVDLMIRPEMIDVHHDDAGVMIEQISFFGHDQLIRLRLADATTVRARTLPRPDLRPGMRVALRVSDPVMAYAAD